MDSPHDRTASLMTPAKLAKAGVARAPVSPAAWLDQMAADAGHAHLRRLRELALELMAQATAHDERALDEALAALGRSLPQLDFSQLQSHGWWARTTGKARSAAGAFSAQFGAIERDASALAAQVQSLGAQQLAHAAPAERMLLEFEVEYRALDTIIDQGARWLQDMRNQLKARMAQSAGDAAVQQQVRDDAARCEILVARLKRLRSAVSAAQQVHQQAQATAARRAALLQMLRQAVASDLKAWRVRLAPLVAAAGDGMSGHNLEGPMQAHQELTLCVQQALADAGQWRQHERTLADSLAALGSQLDS